jgi:pimeloyl-ACP methyl ester carboxylesterase/DNA-binding CsgD family transcriptional regulator
VSNNDKDAGAKRLPQGFMDALIGYALDPTQWEQVARELDERGDALSTLDPAAFLGVLSRAEALAFQLRNEPEQARAQIQCPFVLLDRHAAPITTSDQIATLADYLHVDEKSLTFVNDRTRSEFSQALEALRSGDTTQVLVELRDKDGQGHYAYLVEADNLPSAIQSISPNVAFGLLVAEQQSGDRVRALLQSSFHLTSAESGLAMRLASGLALKEAAQALGISTNTARNHLQSIFEKTAINRQADLILMLTQLNVLLSVIGDVDRTTSTEPDYPPHQFVVVPTAGAPGRRVAYRQYGTGPKSIIYFHESASSSRLLPGTAQLADRLGLTIIAPERPGSAFSDPVERYDFSTTASDVAHLLGELDIDRVGLIGFISGGAHALATASHLGDRAAHLMLVSARGPSVYAPDDQGPLAVLRRRLLQQPWLLSTFFNILRNRAGAETNARLLKNIYGGVSKDLELLEQRADILDHIVGCTLENMTVSAAGIAGEVRCFADPTPVDLAAITAPITIWHGSKDQVAPLAELRDALGDLDFDLREFEERGSLILYDHWEEILERLANG